MDFEQRKNRFGLETINIIFQMKGVRSFKWVEGVRSFKLIETAERCL